jgi:cell division septation protein DedD
MAKNDDKNGADNSSMSDDQKMLKKLFREELDIHKTGDQEQAPPETDATQTLEIERGILNIKPVVGAKDDIVKSFEAKPDLELQEVIEESPIWRYKDDAHKEAGPETEAKPGERSRRLRPALLALLLLAFGAFSINYFGIVDLRKFIPLSEWTPTPVVQPRVPKKPPIPPVVEKRPPILKEHPIPETSVKEPVIVMETPEPATSVAPETPVEEPVAVSEQAEPMPSTPEPAPEKTAPEAASLKEPARERQPPPWTEEAYPYSVYLGSYRTPEKLKKAVTIYGRMGLSPYWVQVDLGKKGKWFRLFTRFFRTRAEADAFIRENRIDGAASKHTKYAVLIGTYKSEKEIKTKGRELRAGGYSSYEVKGKGGVSRLYTGAFYQMARAQKHKADLASKGIQGEVVER